MKGRFTSADVAAMAPGTHTGAASAFPVSGLTGTPSPGIFSLPETKFTGEKILGFPTRLTPTTVAPSPISEVLRFVSPAPHSPLPG